MFENDDGVADSALNLAYGYTDIESVPGLSLTAIQEIHQVFGNVLRFLTTTLLTACNTSSVSVNNSTIVTERITSSL